MVRKKKFDCVLMKQEIQRVIMEEMSGLSAEERRRRTEEQILSDPVMGAIWRKARRAGTKPLSSEAPF